MFSLPLASTIRYKADAVQATSEVFAPIVCKYIYDKLLETAKRFGRTKVVVENDELLQFLRSEGYRAEDSLIEPLMDYVQPAFKKAGYNITVRDTSVTVDATYVQGNGNV